MARRKKTSPIEDLLDIASSINWKISLGIAIISYFFFHYFAIQALPVATDLHSITNSLPKQLFITFSKFLQYIVPIIFIIGACVSSFKGKHRSKLLDKQSSIETIRDMSWQDFELLVGEAFRRKGFEVKENGGGGADGGDLLPCCHTNLK
ncbi:MAG: restriction endonuclease [Methylotenera sp.]